MGILRRRLSRRDSSSFSMDLTIPCLQEGDAEETSGVFSVRIPAALSIAMVFSFEQRFRRQGQPQAQHQQRVLFCGRANGSIGGGLPQCPDRGRAGEYAHEMQQIIHDSGSSGYMTEFARVRCWRWVRWPDSELFQFCHPNYVPSSSSG